MAHASYGHVTKNVRKGRFDVLGLWLSDLKLYFDRVREREKECHLVLD